ncbi:MAG: bifunctional DNA primase/polymerase [Xanthobacteraceae bacterium]
MTSRKGKKARKGRWPWMSETAQAGISPAAAHLHVALLLAKAGIPVVPLHAREKDGRCTCRSQNCRRPGRYPRTKHGTVDATVDRNQIERLWKRWPTAGVGIVTAPSGNLVALKTRGKKDQRRLEHLVWQNEELPPTVIIRAGNQRFRLFRHAGDHPRHVDLADGLQLLGDRALIIAPNSPNRSASRRFCKGRAVGEVETADAPDWLMTLGTGKATSRATTAWCSQDATSHYAIGEGEVTATEEPNPRTKPSAIRDSSSRDTESETPHVSSGEPLAATTETFAAGEHSTSKDELLSIANSEIENSEGSLRAAAEALARAEKDFGATQREMAEAVGRSASWVNRLLKWCRSGYKGQSPFGPTTKSVRVAHAQQRATSSKSSKGKASPPLARGSRDGENTEVRRESNPVAQDFSAPGQTDRRQAVQQPDREVQASATAEVERLKAELAAATERLHELEEEVESARAMASRKPACDGTSTAPANDEDIPAFLDLRPLLREDQIALDAIKHGLANSPAFRAPWAKASILVRYRFFREVLMSEAMS